MMSVPVPSLLVAEHLIFMWSISLVTPGIRNMLSSTVHMLEMPEHNTERFYFIIVIGVLEAYHSHYDHPQTIYREIVLDFLLLHKLILIVFPL